MAKAINEPISFYSKNYLTNYCTNVYDSTPDLKLLCDFDPYKTSNLFQISYPQATFAFDFKNYFGEYIFRTVNTIILQNCNIKNMIIVYYHGDTPVSLISIANNYRPDLLLSVQEVETGRIEFQVTDIFGDYSGIQIGQLRILKKILDFNATTSTSIEFDVKENSLRSYNGTLYAWRDYAKWACNISATGVSKEQYNILSSEILKEKFVTIVPWNNFEIKDVYQILIQSNSLGYDINRFSGKLSLNLKGVAQENASIL
jgi:hypothetical protein